MIKMEINKAKTVEIEAIGILPDITSELLLGIKILKDRFDENGMGEEFISAMKAGLEFVDTLDNDDECKELDDKINDLVDKALKDDDVLEIIMDSLPDVLKADFTKRMKKRMSEKK